MVNSSHFALAAVAMLLLSTGCARNDVSRELVTEQPAEIVPYHSTQDTPVEIQRHRSGPEQRLGTSQS
jgi:hypothetical protein